MNLLLPHQTSTSTLPLLLKGTYCTDLQHS